MIRRTAARLSRGLRARLASASPSILLFLGGATLIVVGGGGLAAYRMYDYVQHDNEFCLSCHLMEDPFERFADSAHRGLGCKACHQPTPFQRARMGLTQFVRNPEVIEAHAEVPNGRCEHCHVEGNPDDWIIISASRGHRLHLESADARLKDLECVTCHSLSIHEFGATNRACTQSGCHDDLVVVLGGMADLDLACVTCHGFVEPPSGFAASPHAPDSLAMAPDADQCLSCHEMRERVGLGAADEPHGSHCSTCHNAHDQRRAEDAEARCSDGLCHGRARDVDDRHHEWRTVDLLACLQCHRPHDFEVQGENCAGCHQDIAGGAPPLRPPGRSATPPPVSLLPAAPASGLTHATSGAGLGPAPPPDPVLHSWPFAVEIANGAAPVAPAQVVGFTHDRHRSVGCASCHGNRTDADASNQEWCVGCHHGGRSGRPCGACHTPSELSGVTQEVDMHLPGGTERRELLFAHERHADADAAECAECHGSPPTRANAEGSCLECHERHHTSPVVTCSGCHEAPPDWAHEATVVHGGCAGGVCHERFPVTQPEAFARSVCEACHTDFVGVEPLPAVPPIPRFDTASAPDTAAAAGARPPKRLVPWGESLQAPPYYPDPARR